MNTAAATNEAHFTERGERVDIHIQIIILGVLIGSSVSPRRRRRHSGSRGAGFYVHCRAQPFGSRHISPVRFPLRR